MSEANKALVMRWFEEVWNKGRVEAIDEMMPADSIGHGLGKNGESLKGPPGFKPFHKQFREALKDIHIEVADIIAEGDRVVTRCVVTGTHTGEFMGVPPSGKKVRFEGTTITRVKNGTIAEGWNYYDFPTMYRTLGVPMQ